MRSVRLECNPVGVIHDTTVAFGFRVYLAKECRNCMHP